MTVMTDEATPWIQVTLSNPLAGEMAARVGLANQDHAAGEQLILTQANAQLLIRAGYVSGYDTISAVPLLHGITRWTGIQDFSLAEVIGFNASGGGGGGGGSPAATLVGAKGDLLVGTAPGTLQRFGAGLSGQYLTADPTSPFGLSWASPGAASAGADIVHVPGIVGNGTTDDAPKIQAVLDTIGISGTHSTDVVVEAPPAGIIFIDSTVQVTSDNTRVIFKSPVRYGPSGRMRIFGELAEVPPVNKPGLAIAASAGDTTITVTDATPFIANCYICIRGARDVGGNVLDGQREYVTVTAVTGNVLTLSEPLENSYAITNANPGTPPQWSNKTEVTRVISALLTTPATRGDRTLTVSDTSLFSVGDYVMVQDDAHTVNATTGLDEPKNYCHHEVSQIKAIPDGTTLRLQRALYHSLDPTKAARVARMNPVIKSSIIAANITWGAMSTVSNALEMRFGIQCSLVDCRISGDSSGTTSWRNQAFRVADSLFCTVQNCYASNPVDTGSGRGYGATLYGATQCLVIGSWFSSLRHSVLLFNGAAGNVIANCFSDDCRISDYDLHGAECVDNQFISCTAVGGDSIPSDGAANKSACKVGNTAHVNGDHHNVFTDMLVINYQGNAFEVVPQSNDNTFRNSRVNGAQNGLKIVTLGVSPALQSTNTYMVNCDIADLSGGIVNINGGTNSIVQGVTIESNRFHRCPTGLVVSNAGRVRIRRNTFYDPIIPSVTYTVNANNVTLLSVRHNDFSRCVRGVKLANCPGARVSGNVMHDLTEVQVFEDAGGNTGAFFGRNDIFGFTPTATTTGTGPSGSITVSTADSTSAGSGGGGSSGPTPYRADLPARHGAIEWNFDPIIAGSGSPPVSGTVYLMKVTAETGGTISNIILGISSVTGVSLTSGQNFVGLYNSAGAQIGVSADQSSAWTSNGVKTMALASPVAITAGSDYYVAIVCNGTTPPSFLRSGTNLAVPNFGQSSGSLRFSTNGTAATALPASITPSANSGVGAITFWCALS